MKTLDEKKAIYFLNPKGTWTKKTSFLQDRPESHVEVIEISACRELAKLLDEKDRVIGIMTEALEFYKDLPMSKQDQLWTQELADKCIRVAHQALEQAEKLNQETKGE
jgi:hypothetical protein